MQSASSVGPNQSASWSTVIVGAGLAGLSCAYHLGKQPATRSNATALSTLVVEREATAGGLSRSFVRSQFTFDCTGHWLHLRDEGIRALIDELIGPDLVSLERRAQIHSHGRRTPYPFQANTHGLPTSVVADCVLGYFRARELAARGAHPEPRTFEDFIRQRMGDGIAEHFMIPYNTKLWTVHPRELDERWCSRFVPVPTPEEVVLGALAPAGAGHRLGYNASFLYPRQGGMGRLAQALSAALPTPIRCGETVARIDWQNRTVVLTTGEELRYEALVSTLPLDTLALGVLVAPPAHIWAQARKLRATTVTYWDVGVPGVNGPGDAHWIYFPEPDVPFYRVGSPSAALPSLAPPGFRSYYVEVAHPRGAACPASDDDVLRGLRHVGLLGPCEEPVVWQRTTIDCAYTLPDHDCGPAREALLTWLSEQRIFSIGRYGSWMYDSMEGAMIEGRQTAARLRDLLA